MPLPRPHRKRVRHFEDRSEVHELTFSCYRRMALLDDDWRREELSQAIDRAVEGHGWRVAAFVYMPNHLHLLVFPTAADARVDKVLFAIKRPFSHRVKQRLTQQSLPLLRRLTVKQRPGTTTFRFWQEGPGYDRNIRSQEALLSSLHYIHLLISARGSCVISDRGPPTGSGL